MNIQTVDIDGVTVIPLEGRLDGNNASVAEQAFLQLAAGGKQRFVFDLAGLQYISSAGLRVILVAAKKLRTTGGRMICAGLTEQVRDVFEMSGFTNILELAPSREEALARIKA